MVIKIYENFMAHVKIFTFYESMAAIWATSLVIENFFIIFGCFSDMLEIIEHVALTPACNLAIHTWPRRQGFWSTYIFGDNKIIGPLLQVTHTKKKKQNCM